MGTDRRYSRREVLRLGAGAGLLIGSLPLTDAAPFAARAYGAAYADESNKLYIGREFTLPQFEDWLTVQNLGTYPFNGIGIHHTYLPNGTGWQGVASLDAIFKYYRDRRGWPEGKGPHIWLYAGNNPDYLGGEIRVYVGTHPRYDGIGISYRNHRWLHIEAIWDADAARFSDRMMYAYQRVFQALCRRRGGAIDVGPGPSVDGPGTWQGGLFHRDARTEIKSCPGKTTTHDWFDTQIARYTHIVDNTDPDRFSASASWAPSSYDPRRYGSSYRYSAPAPVSDVAKYKLKIPSNGDYDIYGWWPASSGYNARTPVWIKASAGWTTVWVDQTQNGGRWVRLGTFGMNAGDEWCVQVSRWTAGTGYIIADAIKVVRR